MSGTVASRTLPVDRPGAASARPARGGQPSPTGGPANQSTVERPIHFSPRLLNAALWRKAWIEARLLLVCCMLLMFAFQWIFVWITSMVKLGALASFVKTLPPGLQSLSGVPVNELATVAGRIGLAYVDPIVLVTSAVWAIARGSDVVSGEINRGSMELLVSQPVRRLSIFLTQSLVTSIGAALIAMSALSGTLCGLSLVTLEEPVAAMPFVPAAFNLFGMTVFLGGVAALASACDRYRWRTIGLVGGFYVIQLMVNVMGRTVKRLNWLEYTTFFGAYEPQGLIAEYLREPDAAWQLLAQYNAVLLGLGLVAYVAGAVIFCRRDLPAPL
ncbi:MAG: ABC transporter permease [Pirellulales bacterium]|nr:ABC transporter permease [Pirellulales bacterium]